MYTAVYMLAADAAVAAAVFGFRALDQLLQPHQTVLRPHLQTQTQPRGEGVPTQPPA